MPRPRCIASNCTGAAQEGGYCWVHKRRKPIGPNPARRKRKLEDNFGDRAEAVRAMPCLIRGLAGHTCRGDVQACHATARGMGGAKGDRHDLWPGCAAAHEEAGERPGLGRWEGTARARFLAKYSKDPALEALRISMELTIAGLP